MRISQRFRRSYCGPVQAVVFDWAGTTVDHGDVEQLYAPFEPLQIACVTDYADLVPGTLETVGTLRARGIRIGSSTGYTAAMMEPLVAAARDRGYTPEAMVTMSDVPMGRPAPWMCFENARQLGVYPMEAVVVVDDTPVGIEAGLNASAWTVAPLAARREALTCQTGGCFFRQDRTISETVRNVP